MCVSKKYHVKTTAKIAENWWIVKKAGFTVDFGETGPLDY